MIASLGATIAGTSSVYSIGQLLKTSAVGGGTAYLINKFILKNTRYNCIMRDQLRSP
jgi:hypothetical protein